MNNTRIEGKCEKVLSYINILKAYSHKMCVCIGKIELQKGASSKVANLESIFANYAQSLLTVYSAYKGAFNNYVDRISPFFDPPAWTVFIP